MSRLTIGAVMIIQKLTLVYAQDLAVTVFFFFSSDFFPFPGWEITPIQTTRMKKIQITR